jgi:hypothetical protein
MNKSKLSALLSLILVFVSGGVLGAFTYRLYWAPAMPTTGAGGGAPAQKKGNPEDLRKSYVATLTKDVKLDESQVQKLNVILDQTHEEFEKLRLKSKPEWDALNEKREALFEKWRPDRDAIQNSQVEKINAILREDQRPLYAAVRAERERQRKLRDAHKKQ